MNENPRVKVSRLSERRRIQRDSQPVDEKEIQVEEIQMEERLSLRRPARLEWILHWLEENHHADVQDERFVAALQAYVRSKRYDKRVMARDFMTLFRAGKVTRKRIVLSGPRRWGDPTYFFCYYPLGTELEE